MSQTRQNNGAVSDHKAAIISEQEENLAVANAFSRSKPFEVDSSIFPLCVDRDQHVCQLAIQKALVHGVDRRFIGMVRFPVHFLHLFSPIPFFLVSFW
jgi:hypothetical protein